MIKSLAKRACCRMVACLPWGVRKSILDSLISEFGPLNVVHDTAKAAGVTGLETTGQYGTIVSAASDRSVFDVYASTGVYGVSTRKAIEDFFSSRPGTYLDLGANIGLTLLPIARLPEVRCVAVEPDPRNFESLKSNVDRNCLHGNVVLHNVALFDAAGELSFEVAEGNLGDHRIHVANAGDGLFGEARRKVIVVPGVRLDDLIPVVCDPLAVKLDVQGAEPFVISGGMQTLSKAGMIIMEFSPYHIRRLGGEVGVVFDFIGSYFKRGRMALREGDHGPVEDATTIVEKLRREWDASKADPNDYRYWDVCFWK